jgi:hypothetical protein
MATVPCISVLAYQRFRVINDTGDVLLNQYEKQARQAAEESVQQALAEASEHMNAAGQVLNLFVDASIPSNASFSSVKTKAFALLKPECFPPVSAYMRNSEFDKTALEWASYAKLSPKFKLNLRHLFTDLNFSGRLEDAPLLDAVTFLQEILRQGQSPRQIQPGRFPLSVIPKSQLRYMFVPAKPPGKGGFGYRSL